MIRQLALRWSPLVAFYEVPLQEAQAHLIAWRHPLHLPTPEHPAGRPYDRPFGRISFVMEHEGRPAAVVVLASTVNASVAKDRGLHRYNCVDLARIGRSTDRRDGHSLRAVLRIAREYLVPLWPRRYPRWERVDALVSTSLPGTLSATSGGTAGLYRFDGFERLRVTTGPSGGGTYGRPSHANAIGDGARGLWVYRYPEPVTA